jgi:hypothetical protein
MGLDGWGYVRFDKRHALLIAALQPEWGDWVRRRRPSKHNQRVVEVGRIIAPEGGAMRQNWQDISDVAAYSSTSLHRHLEGEALACEVAS